MSRKKQLFASIYLAALFAFTGCSANLVISAQGDKSAKIAFDLDLGKNIERTIKDLGMEFSQLGGTTPQGDIQLFNPAQIKSALNGSDIADASVQSPSSTKLSIQGKISSQSFVECGASSLTVTLSPQAVRQMVASLPEETQSYMDLLMAPVLTGEAMSSAEYKEFIAAIYGDAIAAELDGANNIQLTLESPEGKPIKKTSPQNAKKSSSSNRQAVFYLSALDLLTLTETKTFSINW